jgi:hypothetical protein
MKVIQEICTATKLIEINRFYGTPYTKPQACNARLWGSLTHSKFKVTDIIVLAVEVTKCLCPLEHCDRGFKSRSRH